MRLRIELLQKEYLQTQRTFDRTLHDLDKQLYSSQQQRQVAETNFATLNKNYNEKKIDDLLNKQSQVNKDGTILFRTAKYAIMNYDDKSILKTIALLAEPQQVLPQIKETISSKLSEHKDQQQNQTAILPTNQLSVQTMNERAPSYEAITNRPYKSDGWSLLDAQLSLAPEQLKEQLQEPENPELMLSESAIIAANHDSFNLTIQPDILDPIDNDIDNLLNEIVQLVNNKTLEHNPATYKLRQEAEKNREIINKQKVENFKTVNFIKQQEPEEVKQPADLDELILDLCK